MTRPGERHVSPAERPVTALLPLSLPEWRRVIFMNSRRFSTLLPRYRFFRHLSQLYAHARVRDVYEESHTSKLLRVRYLEKSGNAVTRGLIPSESLQNSCYQSAVTRGNSGNISGNSFFRVRWADLSVLVSQLAARLHPIHIRPSELRRTP